MLMKDLFVDTGQILKYLNILINSTYIFKLAFFQVLTFFFLYFVIFEKT